MIGEQPVPCDLRSSSVQHGEIAELLAPLGTMPCGGTFSRDLMLSRDGWRLYSSVSSRHVNRSLYAYIVRRLSRTEHAGRAMEQVGMGGVR